MSASSTQYGEREREKGLPTDARPGGTAPQGVEYHRTLAGEERRIGRGILAIVLLIAGMWVGILTSALLARWLDEVTGTPQSAPGRGLLSPRLHAFGMFANALLLPWSMLIQRWLYGVPVASLHSVFRRFRFALFVRAAIIIVPLFVIMNVVGGYLKPGQSVVWNQSDLLWMLGATLLLVPLQATGEEYGLRGLVFRVAGSWGRGPRTSLVLGLAVTTVVFASIHIAGEPLFYLWYVVFAVTTGLITWRSGGLEISIVVHAAFNTLNFVFAIGLSGDLSGVVERAEGGSSLALTFVGPSLVLIAITAVVWFRTRHTGPVTTPPVDWRPDDDWQRLSGLADRPGSAAVPTR